MKLLPIILCLFLMPFASLQASDADALIAECKDFIASQNVSASQSVTASNFAMLKSDYNFADTFQSNVTNVLESMLTELNTKASVDQITPLQNLLTHLQERINIHSELHTANTKQTSELKNRLTALQQSLDTKASSDQTTQIQNYLTNLQQRIDIHSELHTATAKHTHALTEQIIQLQNAQKQSVDNFSQELVTLQDRYASLQKETLDAFAKHIETTTKTMDLIQEYLNLNGQKNDQNLTEITELKNSLEALQQSLDTKASNEDLTKLTKALKDHHDKFYNAHINVADAYHEISARLTNITTGLKAMDEKVNAADTKLDAIQQQINALQANNPDLAQLRNILFYVNTYGPILGKTTAGHAVSAQFGLIKKLLDKAESALLPQQATIITDNIGIFLTKRNIDCAATSALCNVITTKDDGSLDYSLKAALKNGASHLIVFAGGNALRKAAEEYEYSHLLDVPDSVKTVATIVASTVIHVQLSKFF